MSNQEQTFKNDNIEITLSRSSGSKVKLDIHVSPQGTNAAYTKAIKNVNKEINIPGFRKGKAPDAYIVANYGKYVDQEWQQILLDTAFKEALQLTNVYPFNEKSVGSPKIHKISKEEGADFTISYEAYPEIPEIDVSQITLKNVHPKEVTEDEVSRVIEDIRQHHATWEDVTDRPVQEGDYVELDIDAIKEEQNICKNTRFKVQKDVTAPWMYNLLLGATVNSTLEGMSEKQEDEPCEVCEDEGNTSHHHHHEHEREFKPTLCKITVNAIKKAILPELDDELAKKTGTSNPEELRERVREDLTRRAEEKARQRLRAQLEDKLVEKYPFEIPSSLTKDKIRERLSQEVGHLNADHLSEDEKKAKAKELQEKVEKEINEAYQFAFLANAVATKNQIQVTQQDIVQEYMNQLMKAENPIINAQMDPQDIHAILKDYIVRKKTFDLLLEQVQKTD